MLCFAVTEWSICTLLLLPPQLLCFSDAEWSIFFLLCTATTSMDSLLPSCKMIRFSLSLSTEVDQDLNWLISLTMLFLLDCSHIIELSDQSVKHQLQFSVYAAHTCIELKNPYTSGDGCQSCCCAWLNVPVLNWKLLPQQLCICAATICLSTLEVNWWWKERQKFDLRLVITMLNTQTGSLSGQRIEPSSWKIRKTTSPFDSTETRFLLFLAKHLLTEFLL